MKSRVKWNCLLMFGFINISVSALAIEEAKVEPGYKQTLEYQTQIKKGLRLIQTSDKRKSWMSPSEMDILGYFQHSLGKCGGYADITDFPIKSAQPYKNFEVLFDRKLKHQEEVGALLGLIKTENLQATIQKLSSFHNRYYTSKTGLEAAQWIKSTLQKISQNRTDVHVELFSHAFKQPSVIATIQGNGPLSKQIVIIGGHEDSINWESSTGGTIDSRLAPGADDDASGAATVMEIFRVLVESDFRPARTLQFMTYAGEERGLLGSQDIAEAYKAKKKEVVGVMQLDMTMYSGHSPAITLVTDHVDKGLTDFTKLLVDEYVKIPWSETECGYACSDHASWTEAGYASSFPFEAKEGSYNPYIHTIKDQLSAISPAFGTHFAKLGLSFMIELNSD